MRFYKLVFPATRLPVAESLAAYVETMVAPEAIAVTVFEATPQLWSVEAYYQKCPDTAEVQQLLAETAPDQRVGIPVCEIVPDENWVALSQQALSPVPAGRYIVHGSHDRERVGGRIGAIEIDAGEAFGTAHHPTTRGCLIAIDNLTRQRCFSQVLDLGCGSGLLAIAAAQALPSANLWASDIDPQATEVARRNIALNGMAARITVTTTIGLDHPRLRQPQSFDLVIANILAAPLLKLSPDLARAVSRGGKVILSGLLNEQAPQIIARYRAAGFAVDRHLRLDEWATLVLTRL